MADDALSTALFRALLALRITLGLFLLQWGVEKFVAPQSALAIWGHFYGVTLPSSWAMCLHAVTVAVSWRQLLDPWVDPVNHLFIASIPVLGALLALFL